MRIAAQSWRGAGRNSPFQVTVHNREEDLKEEVDGVYQHRQQVQPCFARHLDESRSGVFGARGMLASTRRGDEDVWRAGIAGQAAVCEIAIWRLSCGGCREARRGKLAWGRCAG